MLKRARWAFLGALVLAGAIVVGEFPLSDLVRARAEVAAAGAELSRLRHENSSLSGQVAKLQNGSTIAEVAHRQYGLIEPGEHEEIVMPGSDSGAKVGGAGASGPAAPLDASTIPRSDLVPSDAALSPPASHGSAHEGFWQRFLHRLEFWNASS